MSLELIRPHFDNHFRPDLHFVLDFYEGACGAASVSQIKTVVGKLNFSMEARDTFVQYQNLIGTVPTDFGSLFFHRIKGCLGSIIRLDDQLKFLSFLSLLFLHRTICFFEGFAGRYLVKRHRE